MNQLSSLSQAEIESRSFIQKVYGWMCTGLLVTGCAAAYMASDEQMIVNLVRNKFLFYGLMLGELALVFWLAGWVEKMEAGTAKFAFLFYSALNGVTMSVIFLIYTRGSIANAFFLTAGLFGIMSAYGYVTKTDLTSIGNFCFMGLIGIILASVANFWLRSPAIEWFTTYAGILIFIGLTAYDTQKIKAMNKLGNDGTDEDTKEAISGALTLYLDFVNLFLKLLSATGKRRD
jgi:FtsH-binding integral membrane protein